MTNMIHRGNGISTLHQWANLFAITNQDGLTITYRLLEVQGLPPGEHYDKNIHRLAKGVSYEIRQPVVLLRHDDTHSLAIPADARLPKLEQQLMPHVATLVPGKETYKLTLDRLEEKTTPIAVAFLQYALRSPLWNDHTLWGSGRAYYSKRPLNVSDPAAGVDVYPGFVWNVVAAADGRLFLAVDTVVRYVERRWLPERLNGDDPTKYLRRYCLYHFGHQWYTVQLWGVTGLSVAKQRFLIEEEGRAADVLTHTKERWQTNPPANTQNRSPATCESYEGSIDRKPEP